MKNLLILGIVSSLVLLCSSASAVTLDDRDKQLHAALSMGLTLGTYGIVRNAGYGKWTSLATAATTAAIIGVIKEISDKPSDPNDLQANGVGIISGVVVAFAFSFY